MFVPCLVQRHRPAGGTVISLGHRLLDNYLEFGGCAIAAEHGARLGLRPEGLLLDHRWTRSRFDTADVLASIEAQRALRLGLKVVRIEDSEAGLSVRTIKRRLAAVAGLYEYLIIPGEAGVTRNPVPRVWRFDVLDS